MLEELPHILLKLLVDIPVVHDSLRLGNLHLHALCFLSQQLLHFELPPSAFTHQSLDVLLLLTFLDLPPLHNGLRKDSLLRLVPLNQ